MWHVSRWHNSHLWTGCTCNNICSPVMSLWFVEWTHLNHMSLNPSKTKYMILTTRQKRQLLHSPSAHLSVGNQQITEVCDHKILGVTKDNDLTWGPHIRDLCKTTAIFLFFIYQSAKIKYFLNFHARKTFFQAHIQSGIDYASTLWDSASNSLQKPLKSLYTGDQSKLFF